MTPKTGPRPRPRQMGLQFMQQCGSAIRNVVANAKFDFFYLSKSKRLVWPKFILLKEDSQIDFLLRNVLWTFH